MNPKPALSAVSKKSARDVSMMINNVDGNEWTRRSTLIGWEASLEDVQEDEDEEDMEEEEPEGDESMAENTVLDAGEDQDLREVLCLALSECVLYQYAMLKDVLV